MDHFPIAKLAKRKAQTNNHVRGEVQKALLGPKMTKHGRVADVPKWSTRVQNDPKWSIWHNFDHLGPFWAHLDPSWWWYVTKTESEFEWRLWSCLTIASLSDKLWAWMMTKTATAKSKGSQASIVVHSSLVMVLVIMIMISWTGVHDQYHDQMVVLMIMVMMKRVEKESSPRARRWEEQGARRSWCAEGKRAPPPIRRF